MGEDVDEFGGGDGFEFGVDGVLNFVWFVGNHLLE